MAALLQHLEAVTGVKAVSIGKPEPILYQQAFETLGMEPRQKQLRLVTA